ncbi:uncharacterized protein PHACADRAFT_162631 [Phanerochaete carnosa HHB-10118-sp]|uniref:Secreted protein n=1 Tax=Phanerochaete carnosa (strain HHB-10118-sp) TaxID=650164 RepID=K5W5K8_PHACS|nr:uncharacterized protein PHACADRAFT_162631 [Phanerochaete carnosa HHB-10118-sp]EKM54244.1 hypothetical protein PHACADRAFT_162631 [Phanerochaete carnosa HHB-10118-sp]
MWLVLATRLQALLFPGSTLFQTQGAFDLTMAIYFAEERNSALNKTVVGRSRAISGAAGIETCNVIGRQPVWVRFGRGGLSSSLIRCKIQGHYISLRVCRQNVYYTTGSMETPVHMKAGMQHSADTDASGLYHHLSGPQFFFDFSRSRLQKRVQKLEESFCLRAT